jgi:mono/diheme cytochrome c family protein
VAMLRYRMCLLMMGLTLLWPTAAQAQNQAEGKKLYLNYCASCHGETGKGDGPASQSLPVKPADHTDRAVMGQLSDKFLREIISKGGSAVGRSFMMPGWGQLTEAQLSDLVAFIRSLAQPAGKSGGK